MYCGYAQEVRLKGRVGSGLGSSLVYAKLKSSRIYPARNGRPLKKFN